MNATEPKKTAVRMLKRYGSNYPGEVCGFSPDVARALIASRAAELIQENVKPSQGAAVALTLTPPKK